MAVGLTNSQLGSQLGSRLDGDGSLAGSGFFTRAARNNSFRTAKNLGSIRVGRPFSFNFRSSVNPDEPTKVYKFTSQPNINGFSSSRVTARGQGVRFQTYTQIGRGKIQPALNTRVRPKSPFFFNNAEEFNLTGRPVTFYLKFSPLRREGSFRVQFVFSPA